MTKFTNSTVAMLMAFYGSFLNELLSQMSQVRVLRYFSPQCAILKMHMLFILCADTGFGDSHVINDEPNLIRLHTHKGAQPITTEGP